MTKDTRLEVVYQKVSPKKVKLSVTGNMLTNPESGLVAKGTRVEG